ncbi:hypothetical protein QTP86_008537 [Hemibagrus guttatus]|nr:hypothetical protein QTP86_008537 [Hemibagrus guttatus]
MHPQLYPDDQAKVAFIISRLDGKALRWAEPLWTQNHPAVTSLSSFLEHFREVFGTPAGDSSIGERLCRLRQGSMTVSDFALQFRTLAAASGWNEQALITTYRQGLDPRIRLHLAAYEDSIGECPTHPARSMVSVLLPVLNTKKLTIVVCLTASDLCLPACALLDSGSAGNFISGALCRQLRLKHTATQKVYQVHAITGRPLQTVCYLAGPLHLQVGALHSEELYLLVLEDAIADIVLGRPWLELHDPILSWKTGEVLKWGEHCFGTCFPNPPAPAPPHVHHLPVQATSVESSPEARPRIFQPATPTSRMSSAPGKPPSYPHIGHGTVPLTLSLVNQCPRDGFTPSPFPRKKPWKNTSRKP